MPKTHDENLFYLNVTTYITIVSSKDGCQHTLFYSERVRVLVFFIHYYYYTFHSLRCMHVSNYFFFIYLCVFNNFVGFSKCQRLCAEEYATDTNKVYWLNALDQNALLKIRRLMFVDHGMFSTVANKLVHSKLISWIKRIPSRRSFYWLRVRLFKLLTELTCDSSCFAVCLFNSISACRRESVTSIALSKRTWPRSRDGARGFIIFQRTTKILYVVPYAVQKTSRNSLHLKNNDVTRLRIEWTFYGDCSR